MKAYITESKLSYLFVEVFACLPGGFIDGVPAVCGDDDGVDLDICSDLLLMSGPGSASPRYRQH